jgi:predicted DNA-binding transcriptional regulator AlpA
VSMATAPKLVSLPTAPANSRLLTAEDVAAITGLSVETLAQWRSQRKGIPFLKLSRNVVRYQQAELDRWSSERIVRVEQDRANARRNA